MQRHDHEVVLAADELRNAGDRRPVERRRWRFLRTARTVLAAGAALGLASFVAGSHTPAKVAPVPQAAPSHRWIAADRTAKMFTLQAPALADLPSTYAVDRELGDGGREDVLTFGAPRSQTAYVHLEIRRSDRGSADPGLFVALVRRAADLAITHASQPFSLPTRLGPFEASEVTLAGKSREWGCLGFRLRSSDTRLRIVGLACGAGGKPIEPAGVACIMDWLELSADAYDPVLKNFFAEADRRRGSACKAARSIDDVLKADARAPSADNAFHARRGHAKKRAATLL